jgi:undecaprenyl-diphosphatase
MNLIQAIILGIIQGITEFLPVSSSAHLVIAPYLFGWNFPAEQILPFDTLVQWGTLAAVIVYFWHDLWQIIRAFVLGLIHLKPFEDRYARMGWLLILATIPAGLFGLLIKKAVDQAFQSVAITAIFLLVTAGLLLIGERFGKKTRPADSLNWVDALWMGIAQAVSVFPGISRSGATITGGLLRDLERPAAARFSFLMSIPVMLAAGALELKDVFQVPGLSSLLPAIGVGFLAAAVVGYFSIRWMLHFVAQHSMRIFAVYCAAVGLLVLFLYVVFPR